MKLRMIAGMLLLMVLSFGVSNNADAAPRRGGGHGYHRYGNSIKYAGHHGGYHYGHGYSGRHSCGNGGCRHRGCGSGRW